MKKKQILLIALSLYAVLSLVSMAAMSIGAALFGAALIVDRGPRAVWTDLRAEALSSRGRIYFFATLALALTCVISLVVAAFNPLIFGGRISAIHFPGDLAKLWYLFWPLALASGLRRLGERERRIVLRSWILALGVLSVIGIQQYFTGWPREQPIPGNPGHFHAIIWLGHHLSVASIFIFPFFATLDEFAYAWRKPKDALLPAPVLGLVAACAFVTLLMTYSRMLWVALPVGLLAWSVATFRNRWSMFATMIILLGAGAAMQLPAVAHRLHAQIGVSEREDLWKANLNFFAERPITGVGFMHNEEVSGNYLMSLYPGQSVFSGHAHNNFLEMLGGTGVLGTAAWIGWCWVIFLLLYPLALRSEPMAFSVGLLCAWLVFQMNGITQVNFWEGKVEHQMMWAVAWSLLWAS